MSWCWHTLHWEVRPGFEGNAGKKGASLTVHVKDQVVEDQSIKSSFLYEW